MVHLLMSGLSQSNTKSALYDITERIYKLLIYLGTLKKKTLRDLSYFKDLYPFSFWMWGLWSGVKSKSYTTGCIFLWTQEALGVKITYKFNELKVEITNYKNKQWTINLRWLGNNSVSEASLLSLRLTSSNPQPQATQQVAGQPVSVPDG